MNNKTNYEYLLSDLSSLKGVGTKTKNLLKKKNINNLFDLLWKLPKSYTREVILLRNYSYCLYFTNF